MSAEAAGVQFWNMPEGLIVGLRKAPADKRPGWAELRTLAYIALGASNNWPLGGEPDAVHSYRSQTYLGKRIGIDRRTVSQHVQKLRPLKWHGLPVLRTTRKGSTAGCLAYGVLSKPKGSTDGRHIRSDVLNLEAWCTLTNAAAVIYLALKDDFRRAGRSQWLNCQIKGKDRDGHLALADRYNTSPSTVRDALAELEVAGLVERHTRRASDGRDIGIRLRLYDEAPPDAPIPTKGSRWLEDLADQVAKALEELRAAGGLGRLGVTWEELKGARSAAAIWKVAKRLRPIVRRKPGKGSRSRAYPVRTLARACGRVLIGGWQRRRDAEDAVFRRQVELDEIADSARDFGPSALRALLELLPSQGPAPEPKASRYSPEQLWKRGRKAIRSAGGVLYDPNEFPELGGAGDITARCQVDLEAEPEDGAGPILWIRASYFLIGQFIVNQHLATLRNATGCRIGIGELPPAAPATGPP